MGKKPLKNFKLGKNESAKRRNNAKETMRSANSGGYNAKESLKNVNVCDSNARQSSRLVGATANVSLLKHEVFPTAVTTMREGK